MRENQASIIAFDNLYSGCTGTVPSVYWAYNTGGQTTTSPVISGDGSQIAITQSSGGVASILLLKWAASTTESLTSPGVPTSTPVASYVGWVAPCLTTIPLTTGTGAAVNDTTSSIYLDYQGDTAWVGDAAGWLHKFHPFFSGTPTEIRTAPWPVRVDAIVGKPLSSPVHDLVSNNVFVGDLGGFVAQVNATSGAVVLSGRLDHGVGIVSGPIVDSGAHVVYVFSSNDGSTACPGTSPCSAVFALGTSFTAGSFGSKGTVGTSSATPSPLYDGGFDSTYLASANGTGNVFVCGNAGGIPTLYQLPINAGVPGTASTVVALTSAATACSPVTDVPNPNATGGAAEWLFLGVQNNASGTNCSTAGCAMSFKDIPLWKASTAYTTVGQQVLDTHSQIQTVRIVGTSGAAAPAWKTTLGATTNDGPTLRWVDQGPLAEGYAVWQRSHAYTVGPAPTLIVDSNNNIQLVIANGTSRTAVQGHPPWSTSPNGVTTDGATGLRWRNLGAAATNRFGSAGGTSGMIIDNIVGQGTLAGASQVYFSTLSNQTCGTSGTGGCAVQASQSALQ